MLSEMTRIQPEMLSEYQRQIAEQHPSPVDGPFMFVRSAGGSGLALYALLFCAEFVIEFPRHMALLTTVLCALGLIPHDIAVAGKTISAAQ